MENHIKVPILSYKDIRVIADTFAEKYHPRKEIPIPIEEIIEFQLGIDIVPVPRLLQDHDLDGYTSCDLKAISVDEFIYLNRQNRYRYTLSHEVGHIVIHEKIYRNATFSNTSEWKSWVNSISREDHSWLEYQAYSFAGLVLAPRDDLMALSNKHIKEIKERGFPVDKHRDVAWAYVAELLADDFQVSQQVIEKRLAKEGIWECAM